MSRGETLLLLYGYRVDIRFVLVIPCGSVVFPGNVIEQGKHRACFVVVAFVESATANCILRKLDPTFANDLKPAFRGLTGTSYFLQPFSVELRRIWRPVESLSPSLGATLRGKKMIRGWQLEKGMRNSGQVVSDDWSLEQPTTLTGNKRKPLQSTAQASML